MKTSKKELLIELNEAINLVNRVRCELNSYYPTMSKSIPYRSNCSIDQDRLQKAMGKLTNIANQIEYDTTQQTTEIDETT
jgi:hypothetical protein